MRGCHVGTRTKNPITLVTAEKSGKPFALVRPDLTSGAFITPEVVAQMKLIVETEGKPASTGCPTFRAASNTE